jgi:hypothetical protein
MTRRWSQQRVPESGPIGVNACRTRHTHQRLDHRIALASIDAGYRNNNSDQAGNYGHRRNYGDRDACFYISSPHWHYEVTSSYETAAMLLARWVDEEYEPMVCQEVE